MSKKLVLNVYDNEGNIEETVEARSIDVMFGTIKSIMEILHIEKATDTKELLGTIYDVWGELTDILSQIFPTLTEEQWNRVKVSELIPVIMDVLKQSFGAITSAFGVEDGDEKN
jgi:hypothetical protein